MKKIAIIAFLFATLFAKSQVFNGGLIGGLAASQIDGDMMGGYNQFGACIGAFLELPLENSFAFEPELRFCQKGSTGVLGGSYLTARLNYIELPLLFNWKYKKVKLEAGVTPALLTNSETWSSMEVVGITKFDIGYSGGFSYLASNTIRLNIRYTHSIPLTYRFENNCLTLALFYYLRNEEKQ